MPRNKLRSLRKKEHLILATQGSRCSFVNYFADIILPHDCLTAINPSEVDLSTSLCGYVVANPLYINALTGGALIAEAINRRLAILAAKFNLPLAVGSQTAGINSRSLRFTYQVVRKYNREGLVMANISASATPRQAKEAVEMISAQILQLHLNPAQELIMPEGSSLTPGLLANIADICAVASVPVIAKEVGFGLGAVQARLLAKAGVRAVDVSGTGGTNFAVIEGRRNRSSWWKPFANWGLPTPLCLADVAAKVPEIEVLASGGVNNGLRALKCLALGADAVGTAGDILANLYHCGLAGAEHYLSSFLQQMRVGAALMGVKSVKELKSVPLLISGKLKDLLEQKGINPALYSERGE